MATTQAAHVPAESSAIRPAAASPDRTGTSRLPHIAHPSHSTGPKPTSATAVAFVPAIVATTSAAAAG